MTNPSEEQPEEQRASRLLRVGAEANHSPYLRELIHRLSAEDATKWVEKQVETILGGERNFQDITEANVSLERLQEIKRAAKRGILSAGESDRVVMTLRYFLSIGLAIRIHRSLLTSQPASSVECAFADLAAPSPEPWSEFFLEVAARAGDMSV